MGMFTKKTWLARLGVGLNKFKDIVSGATMQFESTPDSITQQGTPLTAHNFNDLEARIEAAIDVKMGYILNGENGVPVDKDGNIFPYLRIGSNATYNTGGVIPAVGDTNTGWGNVGTTSNPFFSMRAKTFYGDLSGTVTGLTASSLVYVDSDGDLTVYRTANRFLGTNASGAVTGFAIPLPLAQGGTGATNGINAAYVQAGTFPGQIVAQSVNNTTNRIRNNFVGSSASWAAGVSTDSILFSRS